MGEYRSFSSSETLVSEISVRPDSINGTSVNKQSANEKIRGTQLLSKYSEWKIVLWEYPPTICWEFLPFSKSSVRNGAKPGNRYVPTVGKHSPGVEAGRIPSTDRAGSVGGASSYHLLRDSPTRCGMAFCLTPPPQIFLGGNPGLDEIISDEIVTFPPSSVDRRSGHGWSGICQRSCSWDSANPHQPVVRSDRS